MAAWFKYPFDLRKGLFLVRNQVQNTVADHHIVGVVGQGDLFNIPFDELHIFKTHLHIVPLCFLKHFIGKIETGDETRIHPQWNGLQNNHSLLPNPDPAPGHPV